MSVIRFTCHYKRIRYIGDLVRMHDGVHVVKYMDYRNMCQGKVPVLPFKLSSPEPSISFAKLASAITGCFRYMWSVLWLSNKEEIGHISEYLAIRNLPPTNHS